MGLDNISTRGAVQRIADPMIAGLVIANGDEETVLVRGLGPSLDDFGLAGLSDPRLDLFDADGNLLASNDNWQDSQSADIEPPVSRHPTPSKRRLITLSRGAYTAVLSPVEGVAHGIALAEISNSRFVGFSPREFIPWRASVPSVAGIHNAIASILSTGCAILLKSEQENDRLSSRGARDDRVRLLRNETRYRRSGGASGAARPSSGGLQKRN